MSQDTTLAHKIPPLADLQAEDEPDNQLDMFHAHLPPALVQARTDSELLHAYLTHAGLAAPSFKSVETELSRFLLWCTAHDLTLRQLRIEHLAHYREFLADPQPADEWVSATRWPRGDVRWRPFSGPLSPNSVRQAFRAVKAFLAFARNSGYLAIDPGSLVKNVKAAKTARITRYLDGNALRYVDAALAALPTATPAARKAALRERFLFAAFMTTGARLSEVTQAKMGDIYQDEGQRWWMDVVGKGAKPRRLPVAPELLAALAAYRRGFGLPELPGRGEATPLVLKTRGDELNRVTDEAAGKAMKTLFASAAQHARQDGQQDAAIALESASTHWLRHSMLSFHANNGVPLTTLQATAGHANLSTTALYLHKDDIERHEEILQSLANEKSAGT